MLDLQTKQSKVRPTAGDIKSNPFPFCFCKVLTTTLAMLLFASGAWALKTDTDSQIGTSETPKNLVVTGKLGVGTSSPTNELEVNGSVEVSSSVQARKFIGEVEGTWNTNGSNILYTNGNVGIGTSYPARTLEVNGTIKASLFEGEGIYWKKIPDSSNQGIYFDNGNVKRVGIGTDFPRERLDIRGNILIGEGGLGGREGDINDIIFVRQNNAVAIGGGLGYLDDLYKLYVHGNMEVFGSVKQNSDRRLKDNIKPISNVLPKLQQIDGVYFDWKEPDQISQKGRQIGVVAQAIEAQFPELVTTGGDGYKSVAYSQLSAVLIQAVKELKRDNDALAERIRVLEEEEVE